MDLVILDLEWNSGYCKKKQGFINEIIEFGAVKLNEQMEIIGQFSVFVRPDITKRLNRMVKELTQLSNDDLKNGASFPYAVSKFSKFAKDCVILTWSTSDLDSLEVNCDYYNGTQTIPFLKYYADLQAYCQDRMGLSGHNQIALQAAAEQLGIDTDDIPLHRAVGDSILSARCLKKLYEKEAFSRYIQTVDDEFYRKLNFHSVYLTNPDNPLIDPKEMLFDCEQCNCQLRPLEEWKSKGKNMISRMECPVCGGLFLAKLRCKLLYEGVVATRQLLPLPSEEENSSQDPVSEQESDPVTQS